MVGLRYYVRLYLRNCDGALVDAARTALQAWEARVLGRSGRDSAIAPSPLKPSPSRDPQLARAHTSPPAIPPHGRPPRHPGARAMGAEAIDMDDV